MTVKEYIKQNKSKKEIVILSLDDKWELTSIDCKDCMDEEIQDIKDEEECVELWIINKMTKGEK